MLVLTQQPYLRLIDSCITQLKAQGPSRTCNESKEKEEQQPRGFCADCSASMQAGVAAARVMGRNPRVGGSTHNYLAEM